MNYPTIFPELSTERLTLRQLSLKDKRAIFKLRSNKSINKLITRETPKNLNDAEAFIQTCLDGFETENCVFWAIQLAKTNTIVGTIDLHAIDLENSYAEISYELNPDYQKEGFMDESMKTVLEFNTDTLQLKTIEAFTHQNNSDSTALLEKHQFILQSDRKDDLFEDNHIFRLDITQE
ncbi:GNAT family N-acetyltransferase [Tenacibaculum pacificus]|uniref:GNAT family N-acetyltransferase n=1 Tax=Tenacibaculum pacificus TaxID=3018314 RepID=UPI0022F3BBAD|nr:GNAT family N-acetyltransferase [Tenacibaculum pacificus]WBX74351.1 GNAT family N-acetyltransferase [Tenacibaculum pacificus]